ncbi:MULTISPECIES: toll/interleukin-1 receptor domain-containing protein [Amycolatopsis]|uniref:TIR domain-containing protein n=1 Tax=Amycolatopsis dongchuanensis TaxID=1070866 RepID=A0ABP9R8I2_9PSEU
MSGREHAHDIAMSFSGAQRSYVERVVRECERLGLDVFYDKNVTVQLWGRNVIEELRKVYGSADTRYVVAFLSREYLAGSYPMDEFRTANLRGIQQVDYILPVLMDDVVFPPEHLNPATVYLKAADYEPEALAKAIVERVGLSRQPSPGTGESGPALRRPRLAPSRFSSQAALDDALRHLEQRFQQESQALEDYGFRCRVRTSGDGVSVLVEERGRPVCELEVARGEPPWRNGLTVQFAWPRITGPGVNGEVAAVWDPDSEAAKLAYRDFTAGSAAGRLVTEEEFFRQLWEKIVRYLEQVNH